MLRRVATHGTQHSRRYRSPVADSIQKVVNDLLAQLRATPQDTAWSSYPNGDALVADVERLSALIEQGDPDAERTLRLLFAPTGALQETALSSGWSDNYMRLADRLDAIG